MSAQKRYTFFLEKISKEIRKLIVGQGNSKQRLMAAEVDLLLALSLPVPDDLELSRKKILKKLEKKKELVVMGEVQISSFRQTLYGMKIKTASTIIGEIYDLYSQVRSRSA